LHLYDINTCEDALQKTQCIKSDDEGPSNSSSTEKMLKDKLEKLQQIIKNLTLRRNGIWCTLCCEESHIKYTYSLNDKVIGEVDTWRVQFETYCNICEALIDHTVQDYSYKLKNTKWFHICKSHSHKTPKFQLNSNNRTNVHTIYHTKETDQNNDYGRRNDYYGLGRGGF